MEKNKTSFFRKSKFAHKNFTSGKREIPNEDESTSETETIISDDRKVSEIFQTFFVNIVPSLKVMSKENYKSEIGNFRLY